jgi:hypothetical protein
MTKLMEKKMSLLPTLKVILNDSVTRERAADILEEMKSLKGVFGVHAAQPDKNCYLVTIADDGALKEIRKIDGVKKASYSHIL